MTDTKIEVQVPVKAATAPAVEQYVSPAELCDVQTRSMARDAFSVFSSLA